MGKGLANIRSPQMKHYPDCRTGGNNANITAGNSKQSKTRIICLITEASIFEEPGAGNLHAGNCAGCAG